MFRKLIVPLLVLGAVASALLAPAANAGSKQIYVETLRSAFATFYIEDGCYRLSGAIFVGEGTTKANNDEDRAGNDGHGYIDVYDSCAKQWVLMAEIGGEDLDISITQDLRSASIDETFVTYNYLADEDVAIQVALDWQGGSRKYHDRDVIEVEFPGPDGTTVYAISKAGFLWVDAVATGTITIDGHEFSIETHSADILGVRANSHYTIQ